jgi:DNA repair exonuclease SbcCD nuclease subunit
VAGALNVGLLHTALDGRSGHDRYAPCKIETLINRGYEYWALGHVHQREVVHTEPYVVFPGNLQGRHARELGEKGATLVTFEGDRIGAVEHRSLDVVRWSELRVDASRAQSVDDVLAQAQAELTRESEAAQGRLLAFRVKLLGATPLDASLRAGRERLAEELYSLSYAVTGAGAWLEKLVLATEPPGHEAPVGDDALAEIDHALAELLQGEGAELAACLADLTKKLPSEVLELVPELRAGPDVAVELASDVRSLLRERLAVGQDGA